MMGKLDAKCIDALTRIKIVESVNQNHTFFSYLMK